MDSHKHAYKPYVQLHVNMHGFPQTCWQTLCSIAHKNAWIPTDMLTNPVLNCMWKGMDSPRTCSQKQPRTTQNSPKRPRAAPQRSPKPPRTAQSSPTQRNHRFARICMHFYDTLTLPGYKRLCFTDVFEQAMHFLSIFTINLIRRPQFADPRPPDPEGQGQREPWAQALTGKNEFS